MNTRIGWIAAVFSFFALATTAWAVPSTTTEHDTDDDATIWLTVRNDMILGDAVSYCEVRIRVYGSEEPFSSGDSILIEVYEDDTAGDDLLWDYEFTINSSEVSTNYVDRTFDCSSNFGDDVGDVSELYAEAEVVKDECGFWCAYDRPETDNIDVDELNDDGAETDDSFSQARNLGLGTTSNRINRDQDWFMFELESPAAITVTASHLPSVGRLDAALYNASSTLVDPGTDWTSSTVVDLDFLQAGTYRLRISPRSSSNFNFYDLNFTLTPLATECFPGELDYQACGNCGTRSRYCTTSGLWTPFSSCGSEGVCSPGAMEVDECGFCGTQLTICTTSCEWESGTCSSEGVCSPGTVDEVSCGAGGTQTRECDTACKWTEFDECIGTECEVGETVSCYTGPFETMGLGACQEGVHMCSLGFFGTMCVGEVLPIAEICGDGIDNNCDGFADDEDVACGADRSCIGEPCGDSSYCQEGLTCLNAPDEPTFVDGYCGNVDCESDLDCVEDGVCVELFGDAFCLASCEDDFDCREGYLCLDYGDVGACVPPCRTNFDCADPGFPTCNMVSGICEPGSGGDPEDPVGDDPIDGSETETGDDPTPDDASTTGDDTGTETAGDDTEPGDDTSPDDAPTGGGSADSAGPDDNDQSATDDLTRLPGDGALGDEDALLYQFEDEGCTCQAGRNGRAVPPISVVLLFGVLASVWFRSRRGVEARVE